MYKVGDKVLYRDESKHDLWHEGEIVMADGLASDRYRVSATGSAHWVWRYDSDIKPRSSPNELTVVVNIDASAAIAELDGLGELITQRVKAAVAAGLAGETADLVRERDVLREELAACKREQDDLRAALRNAEKQRDELRESLDSVTTSLDDYASGMGLLAAAIRKARGEGL